MKLCRFVLQSDPSVPRSGLFFEDNVYETDGVKALGIYSLDKVRFLAPLRQPPTVRIFDASEGRNGHALHYHYANPTRMGGPMSEFDVPPFIRNLEFTVRVGVVMKDAGAEIDASEAFPFILGFATVLGFQCTEHLVQEVRQGLHWGRSRDFPLVVGPFLTTPEELEDKHRATSDGRLFEWGYTLRVNGEEIAHQKVTMEHSFESMLAYASAGTELQVGDLIAGPELPRPALPSTTLKRYLQPGDTLQVGVEPLGLLTVKIV
ncbi:MAG TPA: fumarylacetoacetate hydrolase family protein [Fimbriimonadaceae bacterium]|nr:fumarylacetoacetate hydrolase family protein [Fimbriimonadaceae bacterium]HRJ32054.1 fumarylacetoacetate hydrolase family protein [Fimbriimonadaceae bacterium]